MVKAYAEMIRDLSGSNPEKRNIHAQVIIDEADRLSLLVQDIQNLSKIQAGTVELNKTVFDIDEFCRSTVRQFSIMHEKFGYAIVYESEGEMFVFADRERISQVLYNLIGNAINYTNQDRKKIWIRVLKKDKRVRVEVADNGKGIAKEDLASVWDKYYRTNQAKRSVVGSGLGLSIVKNILVLHEADYGVTSELGVGTAFWFELPIEKKGKSEK
jgi:signal transduction histidine kinase